jgi:hypothetical protein
VQRDVRLVADNPAVVPGSDVKEIAGFHFDDAAVVHGGGGAAGDNEADVFHRAAFQTLGSPDVDGPFPSGLVTGATNGHSPDVNQLKFALFEVANFVRMFKALEDDVVHEYLLATGFKNQW